MSSFMNQMLVWIIYDTFLSFVAGAVQSHSLTTSSIHSNIFGQGKIDLQYRHVGIIPIPHHVQFLTHPQFMARHVTDLSTHILPDNNCLA